MQHIKYFLCLQMTREAAQSSKWWMTPRLIVRICFSLLVMTSKSSSKKHHYLPNQVIDRNQTAATTLPLIPLELFTQMESHQFDSSFAFQFASSETLTFFLHVKHYRTTKKCLQFNQCLVCRFGKETSSFVDMKWRQLSDLWFRMLANTDDMVLSTLQKWQTLQSRFWKKKKKGCELELLPARFVPTEPGMFSIPSGSNKFHFLKAVPDLRSFSLSNSAGRACVLKAWEWWRLRRLNTMATFPPLRIQQPLQKKIKNTGSIHLQVFSPLGVFQHLLLRVTQGLRKTSSVSNCGSGFFIWPSGNKWKKKSKYTQPCNRNSALTTIKMMLDGQWRHLNKL